MYCLYNRAVNDGGALHEEAGGRSGKGDGVEDRTGTVLGAAKVALKEAATGIRRQPRGDHAIELKVALAAAN